MFTTLDTPHPVHPLVLRLTQLALDAPSVPEAVAPALGDLVAHTAAVGAAYFQFDGGAFLARSAQGQMPQGALMAAILAHGLPCDTPLIRALAHAVSPLFFEDTSRAPETLGFPDLGVCSLAAAPVYHPDRTLMGAFLMHTFEPHVWTPLEADLFTQVSGTIAALTARLVAEEQAHEAHEAALRALGLALELKDGETAGHTDRVAALALRVGEALGLGQKAQRHLRWGAYLHDVGKLAVPDAVLLKPGKLDAGEWTVMRAHVAHGEHLARTLRFLADDTVELVSSHHERWDGTGYPRQLRGDQIPLLARIFAVVDVYDALVSERPYKIAWTHEAALDEIVRQAGRHFDPEVVRAFVGVFEDERPVFTASAD